MVDFRRPNHIYIHAPCIYNLMVHGWVIPSQNPLLLLLMCTPFSSQHHGHPTTFWSSIPPMLYFDQVLILYIIIRNTYTHITTAYCNKPMADSASDITPCILPPPWDYKKHLSFLTYFNLTSKQPSLPPEHFCTLLLAHSNYCSDPKSTQERLIYQFIPHKSLIFLTCVPIQSNRVTLCELLCSPSNWLGITICFSWSSITGKLEARNSYNTHHWYVTHTCLSVPDKPP